MKKALIAVAAIASVLAFAVPAKAWSSTRALVLVGPHVHADMRAWAAEAANNVPLSAVRVGVYYGDPAWYPGNQVYLPQVGKQGWTKLAVHGLFVHELGHVFDHHNMTSALRIRFMRAAEIPATCKHWQTDCKTVRWVASDHTYVTIPPAEMFAEEYAACALGLTQRGYQDAGYNTYGWVPPPDVNDATLCALIRGAGFLKRGLPLDSVEELETRLIADRHL